MLIIVPQNSSLPFPIPYFITPKKKRKFSYQSCDTRVFLWTCQYPDQGPFLVSRDSHFSFSILLSCRVLSKSLGNEPDLWTFESSAEETYNKRLSFYTRVNVILVFWDRTRRLSTRERYLRDDTGFVLLQPRKSTRKKKLGALFLYRDLSLLYVDGANLR